MNLLNRLLTWLQGRRDTTADYVDSEVYPTRPTRLQKLRAAWTTIWWLLFPGKPRADDE